MPAASDLDQDTFEVEIEGQPDRYRGIFQSYRIHSNYMTPTDSWEFVVYSEEDQYNLRRIWRPLQPVRLYINGAPQCVGRIDGIEGVPSAGSALRVFGRDYLADLVDATIDPQFVVQKDWTLEQALLELLRPFGITEIRTSNFDAMVLLVGSAGSASIKKGKGKNKKARDVKLTDYKAEDNMGVWEYASRIVARHGFMMLPHLERRNALIIDAPNYDQDPLFELRRPGNVLEASAKRDWSGVPTVTIARGRTGEPNDGASGGRTQFPTFTGSNAPSKIGKIAEVQRILERFDSVSSVIEERADLRSRAVPLPGTLYRPLFYRDKDSRNQEQLDNAVRRMVAEKLRETLTYSVTARGHVEPTSGAVYTVDTIAYVSDTLEDIDERLWCFERELSNQGDGPKSELKYLRPDSYVLTSSDE